MASGVIEEYHLSVSQSTMTDIINVYSKHRQPHSSISLKVRKTIEKLQFPRLIALVIKLTRHVLNLIG